MDAAHEGDVAGARGDLRGMGEQALRRQVEQLDALVEQDGGATRVAPSGARVLPCHLDEDRRRANEAAAASTPTAAAAAAGKWRWEWSGSAAFASLVVVVVVVVVAGRGRCF